MIWSSRDGWKICIAILVIVIIVVWLALRKNSKHKYNVDTEEMNIEYSDQSESIDEQKSDIPEVDITPNIPEQLAPRPPPKGHRTSKREELCRSIIEEIYGVKFDPIRPDWLVNPETGRNLELDGYNPQLKIAFEYNDKQHYLWPNFTGQSYQKFIAQVRRDTYKVNRCDQVGVYLITIPYNVPNSRLYSYIDYYRPENYMMRTIGN